MSHYRPEMIRVARAAPSVISMRCFEAHGKHTEAEAIAARLVPERKPRAIKTVTIRHFSWEATDA